MFDMKSLVDMKAPLPFEGISEPGRDRYRTLLLVTALAGAVLFYSSSGPQLPPRPLAPQSGLFERYCRTDELSSGRWEPVVVDGHTWPRLKDSTGYRFGLDGNRSATSCYSRNSTLLPQLVAANSWRWKPTDCAIRPFDPARFVRRLAERAKERRLGGGILFVGEEDSRMQAISLESLLGRYIQRGYISGLSSFSSVQLEGGAGAISFSKSDYLVNPLDWQLPLPDDSRASANATEDIWTERLRGKDIVVVNTGLEWGALTPARTARYIDMAKQVLEHIDSSQSPTLIVRSAVPSKPNCSSEADTSRPANVTEPTAALYRQEDVETLDTIWRDLLQDHPRHMLLQVPPLPPICGTLADTGTVMLNCLPGPIDTWNLLLNHILLSIKSKLK